MRFNVFGTPMKVLRKAGEWQLFRDSDVGMAVRVYDVVIPEDLTEDQLAGYLDDIYHEMATAKHPRVVKVS